MTLKRPKKKSGGGGKKKKIVDPANVLLVKHEDDDEESDADEDGVCLAIYVGMRIDMVFIKFQFLRKESSTRGR